MFVGYCIPFTALKHPPLSVIRKRPYVMDTEAPKLNSLPAGETQSNTSSFARLAVFLPLLLLAIPTYLEVARTTWKSEEQSHGPVILALALWFFYQKLPILSLRSTGQWGAIQLAIATSGAAMYAFGHSQAIIQIEVLGVIGFATALIHANYGRIGIRSAIFPLFLLLFTIPLPGILVQQITLPLKSSVSFVAEQLLHSLSYPVARTGVILTIGQYQLLVADACAGLASIFTLEALGLAYMKLMNYHSVARNVFLAIMVFPCAFLANVIRVVTLVLVTYHLGNDAGQGFVHSFAGILLFLVALVLLLVIDHATKGLFVSDRRADHG